MVFGTLLRSLDAYGQMAACTLQSVADLIAIGDSAPAYHRSGRLRSMFIHLVPFDRLFLLLSEHFDLRFRS